MLFGTKFGVGQRNSLSLRERARVRDLIRNPILFSPHPDLLPEREGTPWRSRTNSADYCWVRVYQLEDHQWLTTS